jgi:hypothetical protein
MSHHPAMYLPRALLPFVAGILCGIACLLVKFGVLAFMTLNKADNFSNPLVCFLTFIGPCISILQLLVLNLAFHHFPQLEIVPVFTAVALIANQTVGGVVLLEFS